MWGFNNAAQLASRARDPGQPEPMQRVPLPAPVRDVAVANEHTLAITADGRVFLWGAQEPGTCAMATPRVARRPLPLPLPGPVRSVAASGSLHAFLLEDGAVYAPACGPGDPPENRGIPALVRGLPPVQAVAVGSAHHLALDHQGVVYDWGESAHADTPQAVAGLPRVQAIAAGAWHSVALDTEGGVWVWGSNDQWQLGTGRAGTQGGPQRVMGLPPVRAIAAGWFSTVVVTEAGSVFYWGDRGARGFAQPAQALGLAGVDVAFPGGNAAVTDGIYARLRTGQLVRWQRAVPARFEEIPTPPAPGSVCPLEPPARR
jgi:alpha-tubulin suppressor-like RCC1 family protein